MARVGLATRKEYSAPHNVGRRLACSPSAAGHPEAVATTGRRRSRSAATVVLASPLCQRVGPAFSPWSVAYRSRTRSMSSSTTSRPRTGTLLVKPRRLAGHTAASVVRPVKSQGSSAHIGVGNAEQVSGAARAVELPSASASARRQGLRGGRPSRHRDRRFDAASQLHACRYSVPSNFCFRRRRSSEADRRILDVSEPASLRATSPCSRALSALLGRIAIASGAPMAIPG